MEIIKRPAPPSGLSRWLTRLPIRLYRMGLGPLMGKRIMLLTHIGRVSGQRRRVVLEVVERTEAGVVAASGFGERADWYRNVRKNPDVTIQIGGRVIPVIAHTTSAEDGAEIMARYAPLHPTAARQLCKIMGFAVDGSAEDYREVGRHIPFVRFVPNHLPPSA